MKKATAVLILAALATLTAGGTAQASPLQRKPYHCTKYRTDVPVRQHVTKHGCVWGLSGPRVTIGNWGAR